MKSAFLFAACLATLSAATDILLPLYLYPLTGAWDSVYNAASTYPSVNFYLIVDPDSGPGAGQYPDTSYTPALAKFKSYSNVKTIGYVHTSYATQTIKAIEANVSTYAGWAKYTASNIAVDGIFFDEAPSADNSTYEDYMSTVASYARDLGLNYIVFNPGQLTTAAAYYKDADLIINAETYYSLYSEASTVDVIPSAYRGQAAIILHDTPSSANISSVVSTMVRDNIGAFYATEDCCYNAISSSLLESISSALESA